MTTRSVMLQKKLHELETELGDLFRLPPPDPTNPDPRRQMSFHDVEQRFIFLENLLSAEINASQPETSDQLQEIGLRLTRLKAEFRDWKEKLSSSNFNNHDDTLSICSDCCTQALVYFEDVQEPGSQLISEADKFSSEKSPEKVLDENVKKALAVDEKDEKIWSKMCRYCGVFGCGMIVGAICMVNLFSSAADYFIQYEAFVIPPT